MDFLFVGGSLEIQFMTLGTRTRLRHFWRSCGLQKKQPRLLRDFFQWKRRKSLEDLTAGFVDYGCECKEKQLPDLLRGFLPDGVDHSLEDVAAGMVVRRVAVVVQIRD